MLFVLASFIMGRSRVGRGHIGAGHDDIGAVLGYGLAILFLLPNLRSGRTLGIDLGVQGIPTVNTVHRCVGAAATPSAGRGWAGVVPGQVLFAANAAGWVLVLAHCSRVPCKPGITTYHPLLLAYVMSQYV